MLLSAAEPADELARGARLSHGLVVALHRPDLDLVSLLREGRSEVTGCHALRGIWRTIAVA
jgi:hypothetical protein